MKNARGLFKDAVGGGVLASLLLGGAVLAECTQIDAATKIASYYQRYQEIRQQLLNMENWYNETLSAINDIVPNLNAELEALERQATNKVDDYINQANGAYGILSDRAAAIGSSEELVKYVGRNVLGENDPCIASALGLGRDVALSERSVDECIDLPIRMVIPYGDGLAPNASIALNGMLASSAGEWPANNIIREDLSWLRDQVSGQGGIGSWLQRAQQAPEGQNVAVSIADQMRLGELIAGRGLSNIPVPQYISDSAKAYGQQARMAAAGRNSYAIEAVAREASVRPQLETLRQQLSNINVDNLDQMTEGQRYSARLSVLNTKETLKSLLNESRLRHEQLEGVLLSIDQDNGLDGVGAYQ